MGCGSRPAVIHQAEILAKSSQLQLFLVCSPPKSLATFMSKLPICVCYIILTSNRRCLLDCLKIPQHVECLPHARGPIREGSTGIIPSYLCCPTITPFILGSLCLSPRSGRTYHLIQELKAGSAAALVLYCNLVNSRERHCTLRH